MTTATSLKEYTCDSGNHFQYLLSLSNESIFVKVGHIVVTVFIGITVVLRIK